MTLRKIPTLIISAAGFVVLLAYLNFAIGGIELSERLSLVLAFAIGPVAIFGVLSLTRELSKEVKGSLLRIATVFLVIAFALLNLMIVVQQSIFSYFQTYFNEADGEAAKDSLRMILKGVNPVQLGIDVSFDIFYCLGIIMLSAVILRLSLAHKVLATYGILSSGALLVLNLWTFPVPPADAGLIDFGPFTALFWITLIIIEQLRKRPKTSIRA